MGNGDDVVEVIEGWRGQTIRGARSRRGGVFAACDWRELVLDATGDIEKKAAEVAGRAAEWFSPEALALLTATHGHYSYVQSINSEDTVTWAAFGPRASSRAIVAVLDLAFGKADRPAEWKRIFWERYPHPQKPRTNRGPEPDVTFKTEDGWCYVVEAKWGHDLDDSQGTGGSMTQLEMRAAVATALASDENKRGVLVIVPGPERYPYARRGTFAKYFQVEGDHYVPRETARALGARIVTWEQVIQELARVGGQSEVLDYLRWRIDQLPLRMTDEELWAVLEEALQTVPSLRAALPPGYPRGSFGISVDEMAAYDARRSDRFWHHLNLPMALYARVRPHDHKVQGLMASLLKALDDFAARFGDLPGAKKTLQPLWKVPWAPGGPEFWSVVACAFLALTYAANGYQVESFGAKIGDGDKDSDITILVNGVRTHVDVELWHATKLPSGDREQIKAVLKQRADAKIGDKFPHLPENEQAIAAIVCVATGADLQEFASHPELAGMVLLDDRPRRYGFIYWLCGISGDGMFFFDLRSKPLPAGTVVIPAQASGKPA